MNQKISILGILLLIAFQAHGVGRPDHSRRFQDQAALRTIQFAGCTWNVRGNYGGPGPNYFSDSETSVWVDDQGRLHLKIRQVGTTWYCAEVYTTQFTTYGEHRFLVDGRIDLLDRNIVLGLFTYADDAHEIDIEFSRWGDPNYARVGSFTVQPWSTVGNSQSFVCHLDSAKSTHYFNWQPDSITFASMHGHHLGTPPSPSHYIQRWTYNGPNTPRSSDHLRTHINYWLFQGVRPLDIRTLEVIITDLVQPLTQGVSHPPQPPPRFELFQNYPNPFTGTTWIPFQMDFEQNLRLKIYDLLGHQVFAAALTPATGAKNLLPWDGRDAAGQKVSSGIYYYQLEGMGKSVTRKLIYLNRNAGK